MMMTCNPCTILPHCKNRKQLTPFANGLTARKKTKVGFQTAATAATLKKFVIASLESAKVSFQAAVKAADKLSLNESVQNQIKVRALFSLDLEEGSNQGSSSVMKMKMRDKSFSEPKLEPRPSRR